MTEETKPATPIQNAHALISGLRITAGDSQRIEFRLSFPLTADTEPWVSYLAHCLRFGSVYVDLRSPAPTLDDALEDAEVEVRVETEPAEPSDLFPGWPKACGKRVYPYGMNAKCDDQHVTTTPLGEPCNYMPEPPPSAKASDDEAEAST